MEMHSKWRYQICISVIGHSSGTSVFSKLRGIKNYFPGNFICNVTSYEGDNFFQIPSFITFLNSNILGFLFTRYEK